MYYVSSNSLLNKAEIIFSSNQWKFISYISQSMLLWPPCTLTAGLVFRVVAKVGKFMFRVVAKVGKFTLAMLKAIINK